MVLYLTDNTTADEIRAAKECGFIHGCKYYPAGATTNSDSGVTSLNNIQKVLATMQEVGMVLQLHGEVTAGEIDIFDREAVFIERHLRGLVQHYPKLKLFSSILRRWRQQSLSPQPVTMWPPPLRHSTCSIIATICWLGVLGRTCFVCPF